MAMVRGVVVVNELKEEGRTIEEEEGQGIKDMVVILEII